MSFLGRNGNNSGGHNMSCAEAAPLLVFLACDEVTSEERAAIESHLASCGDCRAQFAEAGEFHDSLVNVSQSADELDRTGILLAQCRSELAESLDEMAAPPVEQQPWRPFSLVRRWMALRPGWSAAGLLTAGAILGVQVLQWLPTNDSNLNGKAVSVSAAPKVTDDQLARMAVSGINFSPNNSDGGQGNLQVHLRAEQPVVLSGSLDDSDMRRVLTYVVRNSDRFDAGVRLDCLDALKSRIHDEEVRDALLEAAHSDKNPAVRMKALESLREIASDEEVRDAVLETLQGDVNPGVRVEAINLLVRSLEVESAPHATPMLDMGGADAPVIAQMAPTGIPDDASAQRVVRALEELQRHDPNRYVRIRSAAALRQIGPSEIQ